MKNLIISIIYVDNFTYCFSNRDKDIDGFDGIMIGVKKPMYAKVLVSLIEF